jgi:hypothetical protein
MPDQQEFHMILHDKGKPEVGLVESVIKEQIYYSGEIIRKEIGTFPHGNQPRQGYSGKEQ